MSASSGAESPLNPQLPNEHPEVYQDGGQPAHLGFTLAVPPAYFPGGRKSLSGISIRAFGLGIAMGVSATLTFVLIYLQMYLWRAPFFIATLAIFHYLEFDMTARYNNPDAKVSSFLLTSNGSAYNTAHTAAMTELLVRSCLKSAYKPHWATIPMQLPKTFPSLPTTVPIAIGIILILTGQYVRSAAMATAGKSFNHLVQSTKKEGHVLVTNGIYAFSRHPSYFGFFWWGLGTQLVLGNHICLPAYALVLWKFFATRIIQEEQFLVQFFGSEYVNYRRRTPVLIPFIR